MALMSDEENSHTEKPDYPEDSYEVDLAVCGDPQVDPRVGDEYQVEVSSMMLESECASLLLDPIASDLVSDPSLYSFAVGLPIQVVWINRSTSKHGYERGLEDGNVDVNESLRSLKAKGTRASTKIRGQIDENLEPLTEKAELLSIEAVPGQMTSSWEDSEVESFVLGLYTFGKNFTQVKKFMESKQIGEILFFYYGKFYKSAKYRSWSDSRKKRNRRCVCGMKLYSGWRQQQLLSRLVPSLADESQKDRLVNVSKTFAEGNASLENYVSLLKEIVGLRALVDAVAIGKVKEDLTIVRTEPVRTKQWFTVSSNSSGAAGAAGAYASLTSSDIVKELTSGSRLSKARCNDIFWEAVWPRLLARGWHSEQPKDRGYVTSKDYLVFLVPGVKKFSRGKLVKGGHYFDSVSDILKKVASDPELLEFEAGEVGAAEEFVAEDSSGPSDREVSPRDSQRHRYLISPGSNRRNSHTKFTVVDTSFAAGGRLCELRELKNLDKGSPDPMSTTLFEGEIGASVPGNARDNSEHEKACKSIPADEKKRVKGFDVHKRERRRAKDLVSGPMRFTIVDTSLDHGGKPCGLRKWRRLPSEENLSNSSKWISSLDGYEQTRACFGVNTKAKPFENLDSRKNLLESGADSGTKEETVKKDRDRSKRVIKNKFIRRAESNDHSVSAVPFLKRRRLSACVRREISRSDKESPAFKSSESDRKTVFCPDIPCEVLHQDSSHEEMKTKNEEKSETVFLVDNMHSKPDRSEEFGIRQPDKDRRETRRNGFSSMLDSDKNSFSEDPGTIHEHISSELQEQPNRFCSMSDLDKKCSSKDLGTSQEQEQLLQPSSIPKLDNSPSSKGLETIHEPGSSEEKQEQDQQINADVPRRQSTRKRPLTTRALEALESGFFTTKKMKSMAKPRKRERPLKKKQTAKARNRASVSDSGVLDSERKAERSFLVKKATKPSKALDQIEDSKPSFLAKKATTANKPLKQIEDSKPMITTEVPRIPPIVWKLPPKQDSEAARK